MVTAQQKMAQVCLADGLSTEVVEADKPGRYLWEPWAEVRIEAAVGNKDGTVIVDGVVHA